MKSQFIKDFENWAYDYINKSPLVVKILHIDKHIYDMLLLEMKVKTHINYKLIIQPDVEVRRK